MKRFTDTEIWKKQWFMDLTPVEKLAFFYIKDQCDNVGVWSPNFRLAEFIIGNQLDWDKFAEKCNGNIYITEDGKWWMVDFCAFQHPDLVKNPQAEGGNKALKSYVDALKHHGLYELFLDYIGGTPLNELGASDGPSTGPYGGPKHGTARKGLGKGKEADSLPEENSERVEEQPGVYLSDEDKRALREGLTDSQIKDYCERVSDYQLQKGKKYKDHRATIRNWAKKDGAWQTKPKQPTGDRSAINEVVRRKYQKNE